MKTRKNQNDKFMNIPIPNAFIFCPVVRAFQCKKTLEKGIFVCENEMDDVEQREVQFSTNSQQSNFMSQSIHPKM